MNKAFTSHLWSLSLEDLLTDTPVPEDDHNRNSHEIAKKITKANAEHSSQMRSFSEVNDHEICGLIDAHKDEIIHAFKPHMPGMLPRGIAFDMSKMEEAARSCLNLVYSIVSAPKPNIALPQLRILAGLYAFIRWQRNRAFQFQDSFDLRHASAAIPYCDVFLTERFLKTACTSKLLNHGLTFSTQIISDEDEALEVIARLRG